MEPASADSSSQPTPPASNTEDRHSTKASGQTGNAHDSQLSSPTSGISSWARNLKFPQALGLGGAQQNSQAQNAGMSAFARLTGGLGLQTLSNETAPVKSGTEQSNLLESVTKGLVDSSKSAVKAVQVKARHIVSQNKRRYQEDGFDLDMTYITENIIAMGFPGGDFSSGIFGYIEGFYRNHMDEVIKFFETHHKVATFPFSDHNCPPIQLIASFCQSAYSWLKEDIQNVVVVHCKAEEAIDYFNHKRCVDGKALILPSQIRYVKYFERTLTHFNGEVQPGRRCMLRGFRLHECPYWVRPSIQFLIIRPEDFWISAPKKGIVVFALPGEPGLTELVGDFKIQFQDRQGDFYCWMNTTLTENRKILDGSDFDGFDKRKIPAPGFKVEIVMIGYNAILPANTKSNPASKGSDGNTSNALPGLKHTTSNSSESEVPRNGDDDVFSDSDEEETRDTQSTKAATEYKFMAPHQVSETTTDHVGMLTHKTDQLSLQQEERKQNVASEESDTDKLHKNHTGNNSINMGSVGASDIKAIAADASVFSFGDEDFESD
ncbi:hypothetical protein JHK84_030359 [Glycine max]|nr:hypothetical protein JHK84_030359 [Glycine max]